MKKVTGMESSTPEEEVKQSPHEGAEVVAFLRMEIIQQAIDAELKLRQSGKTNPDGAWRTHYNRGVAFVYATIKQLREKMSFDQVTVFKKMMPFYINVGFSAIRPAQNLSWLVRDAVKGLRDDPIFMRRFGNRSTQLFIRRYDDPVSTYKKKPRGPQPKLWRNVIIVGVIDKMKKLGWRATRSEEISSQKTAPDGRLVDCFPISASDMVAEALMLLDGRKVAASHVMDIYRKYRNRGWVKEYKKYLTRQGFNGYFSDSMTKN